jgi:signal transduction histidine kinase
MGDAGLAGQMQEHIVKLQQALKLESTLRCISDRIRASLDEVRILETTVQELALELGADCYASVKRDSDIDESLQARKEFRWCLSTFSLQEKSTLFTCPIVTDNDQLGSLWINRERSEILTDSEIYLVQQVVEQCAIAIHQSRLYQAAQKQVEELRHLNEAKNDFLNQVTHDLRSPLSNMRLAIHMLEHQLVAGRSHCGYISQQNSACSKTLTYLKVLQSECKREITLVNDLLDLQRLESNQQPLNLLDEINLRDWFTNLIQPFKELIQQRQLTLDLRIAPNLSTLISDSASLHRVLSELLNNACKYTPPHETISLSVFSELNSVHIKISNSGIEIPAEELPRVFDKFYRIPGSDRWKQGGTGLGLALVKETITHLRGSIRVESQSRQTCFEIQLPLQLSV